MRTGSRAALAAAVAAALAALVATAGRGDAASTRARGCPSPPAPPPPVRTITRPRWLSHVLVTEYFPAPERWFDGRLVAAPGLAGKHRIDWLYSARGLAMQGEGVGRDGRFYHFAGPYSLSWRNRRGAFTLPCVDAPGAWDNGRPAWIGRAWLNGDGRLTYPRPHGRWSNGRPVRTRPSATTAAFAPGPSLRLEYWRDAAVDPRLIPRGSRLFVRAYCPTPSRGWLHASDTGGAIIGPHVDVFRAPPRTPWRSRVLRGQKIFVVPPGREAPAGVHC